MTLQLFCSIFSLLLSVILQGWSHVVPHDGLWTSMNSDAKGWWANYEKSLGSGAAPWLQNLALFVDLINLILHLVWACRACSDGASDYHTRPRNQTVHRDTLFEPLAFLLHFGSGVLKGCGCAFYFFAANTSHHRNCCLMSAVSAVINMFGSHVIHEESKARRPYY